MTTVPARVADFAARHLRTIDDLQVLLACMEAGDRWWSTDSTARQLGIAQAVAAECLDHLARQNLFDLRVSNDIGYRFSPGTAHLKEDALALLAEYRRRPLNVVRLITGNRDAQDFADAFRFKRHDDR